MNFLSSPWIARRGQHIPLGPSTTSRTQFLPLGRVAVSGVAWVLMRNIVADVALAGAQRSNEPGAPLASRRSDCTGNNCRPGSRGPMVVRLIEHGAAFDLLEGPWSALAAAAGARPFQDFYWAKAWIQTIGRSE